MLEIDGSYLEGGGQIIRTAIALSAVTGKPCKIFNIRANRPNPGLQAQHLKGIEACAEICNAKIKGVKNGSTEVEFVPGKICGGEYRIDVGTAGAISLVLQTLIVPSIHAEKEVVLKLKGGTDVKWSPTMAYFEAVVAGKHSNLSKIGIEIETKVLRAGFYPKGGGEVEVKIKPCKQIKPINFIEQGKIERIGCWSFASNQLKEADVAERQLKGFEKIFKKVDCKDVRYVDSLCAGSSITAHAHCNNVIGASALGERGKKAEEVGKECGQLLQKQIESGACLDEWMADQILPFMALAGAGKVKVAEITKHAQTNIWVIEKFLPVKFEIDKERKIISVRGI